ncbi:MAG TPA: DUF1854 domain-containing protein [Abditibacteriaceae bacterium]|jgi:hypothetical protein
MQITFLDSKTLQLERRNGALVLLNEGRATPLAPPRRALPLSQPDEYIVLSDSDGNEVGWLRHLNELTDASRAALDDTLSETYAVMRIRRVLEVEREAISGNIRWRVEIENEATPDETNSEVAESDDTVSEGVGTRLFKKLSRDKEEPDNAGSEEREFFIAGQEDVQTARYPQIYIVDTERNRYEILDCEALDIESRRQAERFF